MSVEVKMSADLFEIRKIKDPLEPMTSPFHGRVVLAFCDEGVYGEDSNWVEISMSPSYAKYLARRLAEELES